MSQSENCVEILQPFFGKYGDNSEVQLIGGIGSAALENPESVMRQGEQSLVAPEDFSLSTIRPNGTRRDVDVFVVSSDTGLVNEVQEFLEHTVDGRLDVSVFGIHGAEKLQQALRQPMGATAMLTFLSDRYKDPSNDDTFVKSLFPFMVPIDPASFKPWRLEVGDHSVSIPHPALSVANYCNRSISGVREKDTKKVAKTAERLRREAPGAMEWLYDGSGASQLELARLIHSAGVGIGPLQQIFPDLPAISRDYILDHEAFMLRDEPHHIQKAVLGMFAAKANLLRGFESSETVRKLWQQFAERGVAAAIVENR